LLEKHGIEYNEEYLWDWEAQATGFRPFRAGKFGGVWPGARTASLGLRGASPGLYSWALSGLR